MGARNIGRLWTEYMTTDEQLELSSSDVVKIRPRVDDTGSINIGDGTYDIDLKVFLGSATEYADFNVGDSQLSLTVPISSNAAITTTGTISSAALNTTGTITPSGNSYMAWKTPAVVNSNSLTVNATHYGGLVQIQAGEAATVTLPTPAAAIDGAWLVVGQLDDQDLTVNCSTADKIVVLNNASADTLVANTANEKIGAKCQFVCDGTLWHSMPLNGTWTATDAA